VCPPGLHITLGIFLRLFLLLENECHKLDLANHIQGSDSGPSYEKYSAILQQQTHRKDEQHSLKGDLKLLEQTLTHYLTSAGPLSGVLATTNPLLLDTVKEIQETKNRIQALVSLNTIIITDSILDMLTANRHRQIGGGFERRLPQRGRAICQGIGQCPGFLSCPTPGVLLRVLYWKPRASCTQGTPENYYVPH